MIVRTRNKKQRSRRPRGRSPGRSSNGWFLILRRWLFRGLLAFLALTVVLIFSLRWVAPPTSMFMIADQNRHLLSGGKGGFSYHWIPLAAMAPDMPLAAVAAEDQKFPNHFGFDFSAMSSALQHNKAGGSIRGGSTISQQVAKNLFLWSGRSYLRKGLEAGLTLLIELLLPKRRILEIYLNIAQFGDGIYGVHAAAAKYFNRSAKSLSRRQTALLAATLPNPDGYRPDHPSGALRERARWVERQMANLGSGYLADL